MAKGNSIVFIILTFIFDGFDTVGAPKLLDSKYQKTNPEDIYNKNMGAAAFAKDLGEFRGIKQVNERISNHTSSLDSYTKNIHSVCR